MGISYIGIWQNDNKPATELCCVDTIDEHFSRFTRGSVREIGREINRTVAEATRPGTRQSKPEDQFTIHIYARSEGCAGIIVADQNYDKLVAHQLLSKILDEFTSKFPKSSWSNKAGLKTYQDGLTEGHLGWYIKEFQDPNNGDSIMKIQKELNETKETLQKAIQSTLERGKHGRSGTTAGGRPYHGAEVHKAGASR